MKSRPNLLNFFYLLGSGLAIHFMGTVYRIWLARKIGADGLGVFQMAYPVYRLLSGLATIGLPMAITKWVAEYLEKKEFNKINQLKTWSLKTVIITSLISSILLLLSAPLLGKYIFTDPRVKSSLLIICIAIPFSALSAIYRSYFQGFSLMAPTALSEITEQISEITTACLLLMFLSPLIKLESSVIPMIGLTVGEIVCFLTVYYFNKYKHSIPINNSNIGNIPRLAIFNYAWPLLLNQIVVSISAASEASVVPKLLISSGYTLSQSTNIFGVLNGMAAPVAFFPLIFMLPLASVLSPQVSSATQTNLSSNFQKKIQRYYLAAISICLTGFFLIFWNAEPLALFLYGNVSSVDLIRLLVIGLPFAGIAILNLTILSAVGSSSIILMLSLWGIGLKTMLFFILIKPLGINGAAWSITVTQIFIFLASFAKISSIFQLDAKIHPRLPQLFRFPTVLL